MGVPTLYEALLGTDNKKLDLSFVKCIVSGGDSMSESLIRKLNVFLENHGCRAKIIQGYGMTEALAAVCVSFKEVANKEGSIGIFHFSQSCWSIHFIASMLTRSSARSIGSTPLSMITVVRYRLPSGGL